MPLPSPNRKPSRTPCTKCGAQQVMPDLRILDQDGEFHSRSLSLQIHRNPYAMIFKGEEVVDLRANVCGNCGYTELYATNPGLLWDTFNES